MCLTPWSTFGAPGCLSSLWHLAGVPGIQSWRIVGQKEALRSAGPHGMVGVEQQPWETVCEVLDEASRELA